MSTYSRGRAFEYRGRKAFLDCGWLVIRSAGSHTPADLVVFRPCYAKTVVSRVLLVQCKCSFKPYISPSERRYLKKGEEEFGVEALLACKKLGGGVAFYDLDYEEKEDPLCPPQQ